MYYITDIIEMMAVQGLKIGALLLEDNTEVLPANNKIQLEILNKILRIRINTMHMQNGVTIEDINSTKRKKITRYTNSQTAVTGKDFFALEDFHYQLQKDFLKLGYNYIIQRKDKIDRKDKKQGNKNYSYLFAKKFSNAFFAKDVVQAFADKLYVEMKFLNKN